MCARINTWYRAGAGRALPWRDWEFRIAVQACNAEDGIWHRSALVDVVVCIALICLQGRRAGWGIGEGAVCWLVRERCRRRFRELWGRHRLGCLLCFGEGLALLFLARFLQQHCCGRDRGAPCCNRLRRCKIR